MQRRDEIIGSDGGFIGMTTFGASAPGKDLYKHFGITAEAVAKADWTSSMRPEPRRTSID
jgi:transketolase